jgi:hypothetical protein
MAGKRPATAAVVLRRPPAPITESTLADAIAPLLTLLDAEWEDVSTLHITHGSIRVGLIPKHRGRRQLDSMLRVTYPVVFDDGA